MTRRWMRNHATADKQIQAQGLFWFLRKCCEFILIDINDAADWLPITEAVDGILNAAAPSQFKKLTSNPYAFSAADIGRHLAIRDNTNPTNSGIYTITAHVDDDTVNLNAPVAAFVGNSINVSWTVFDSASAPANDAWFVLQSPGNINWQARVIVQDAVAPKGLTIELGAFGGWDTVGDTWILPVSGQVNLHEDVTQTFCVADEDLGGFFVWSEDGAVNRSGILCTEFAGIHAPQGLGIPADDAHVALLGAAGDTLNTLNRKLTGGPKGFATDGYLSLPDKSGYANAFLHQWRRIADDFDMMSVPGGEVDPRSGEGDSYGFVVYQILPFFHVRGFLPLIRMVHDGHANKFLLNAGTAMAVQAGVGVEWDTSTPL